MSMNEKIEASSGSLAELFHLVRSLIPEGQQVVTAPPDMTVAEAIGILRDNNFTQLPIVAGNAVLGVFSFRSLAQRILGMGSVPGNLGDLPVDEFLEQFQFVQPMDNWESLLKHLDRKDGVLVGHRDRLDGIVTPMDVLDYLHRIASPFVMLAEIELSLRRIIEACVGEDELQVCIHKSLSSKYDQRLPNRLSEMTFSDYAQIIGDKGNWPHFATVFGSGDWQRKTTAGRLKQVGLLRNEVFHFRREITPQDIKVLSERRDWLQMKARAFEGRKAAKAASTVGEKAKTPTTQKSKGKKWDEASFLADLTDNRGAKEVVVARQIFEWSRAKGLVLRWGRGKGVATCYVAMKNKGAHSAFGLWSSGYVEPHFGYLERFPPFDDERKQAEWLQRLNAIPGVEVSETETGMFPYFPLSGLTNKVALESFLDSVAWVLAEIERVAAGGPDAPAREDYHERIARIRKAHPRAYESWTKEEEANLIQYARAGQSVNEIARRLQRQPGAIRSRIQKLESLISEPKEDSEQ